MNNTKAVIFDLAGTLVDWGSQAPVDAFYELFLSELGVSLPPEEIRRYMGSDKIAHLTNLLNGHDPDLALDPGYVTQLYSKYLALQTKLASSYDKTRVFPGVLRTQYVLRQRGYKIGTTTGYTKGIAEPIHTALKDQGFISDVNITSDMVSMGRPSPFMLYKAMDELKVFPTTGVIKVGDSTLDIEEAVNAGCWAIGVTLSGNEVGISESELRVMGPKEVEALHSAAEFRLKKAGAHFVIHSVAELIPCINMIETMVAVPQRI